MSSDSEEELEPVHVILRSDDLDDESKDKKEKYDSGPTTRMGKIRALFSVKSKKKVWCYSILLILLLAIILVSMSFKRVDSIQYGVQYHRYKKQLNDAVRTGGLHAGPPGYRFIKFPSTFVNVDLKDDTCVSRDGLRVEFSVTFQYRMPAEWLVDAVLRYRNYERWATVVEAAGNSAVQHSCSEFDISSFQNQRGDIQNTMETNLRTKLEGTNGDGSDGLYARAISLNLRYFGLPTEYRNAVAEKQKATEDITLARNQRIQETTKAETELLTAKEEARKIIDTAQNDAEVALTEARLKANETLFAFSTEAEVISRVKNALNLTVDGVLAYLANEFVADVPTLSVAATEPAKFSRRDEL